MADALLTAEQRELQQVAREFVAKHVIPISAEFDRTGEFPEFLVLEAKKAGILCLAIPKEYGGCGYSSLTQSLVIEEYAYGDLGVCTSLGGNGLSSYPVMIAGTDAQKRFYFTPLVEGGLGSFALTEADAGSDAGSCKTVAQRVGDEYVLNGTKCFTTSGKYAKSLCIIASTSPGTGTKGLSAFLVEGGRKGLSVGSIEHKLGIRSSNTVELVLNDLHIPADHLLGKEGDGMNIAMKTLDMARSMNASQAVGLARRAMDESIKYVRARYPGGKSRPSQAVQFKLADMEIQIAAARAMVRHTCSLKDAGFPYSKESAITKTLCADVAMRVTADMMAIMGRYGYSEESAAQRLVRDAKIQQIYEGTNQIQRIVIARQLLSEAERSSGVKAGE